MLDAYCPHLGANIGHGGKVEGDTIRCPFHGWRFGGDGTCIEVPYAQRIPPKARLVSWPLIERNGAIWIWRHAEGKPPTWDVPEIPEFGLTSAGLDEALATADLVCIVTAHPQLDYQQVVDDSALVLDFRGVTRGIEAANLVRL